MTTVTRITVVTECRWSLELLLAAGLRFLGLGTWRSVTLEYTLSAHQRDAFGRRIAALVLFQINSRASVACCVELHYESYRIEVIPVW